MSNGNSYSSKIVLKYNTWVNVLSYCTLHLQIDLFYWKVWVVSKIDFSWLYKSSVLQVNSKWGKCDNQRGKKSLLSFFFAISQKSDQLHNLPSLVCRWSFSSLAHLLACMLIWWGRTTIPPGFQLSLSQPEWRKGKKKGGADTSFVPVLYMCGRGLEASCNWQTRFPNGHWRVHCCSCVFEQPLLPKMLKMIFSVSV